MMLTTPSTLMITTQPQATTFSLAQPRLLAFLQTTYHLQVHLLASPILHACTKHIEIDLYYVWGKILKKQVQICHLSSSTQLSNIFTKAVSSTRFLNKRDKLNVTLN